MDNLTTVHLPAGVIVHPLTVHTDQRGDVAELFRREWPGGFDTVQWNMARSAPGVLRGMHVHRRHWDYLVILSGRAVIGLRDLRDETPTPNCAATVELDGGAPTALTTPPGVAHGFYFPEESLHVYGVSDYWDLDDELGCHWRDPELGIDWPMTGAVISERDAALPSLAQLRRQLMG